MEGCYVWGSLHCRDYFFQGIFTFAESLLLLRGMLHSNNVTLGQLLHSGIVTFERLPFLRGRYIQGDCCRQGIVSRGVAPLVRINFFFGGGGRLIYFPHDNNKSFISAVDLHFSETGIMYKSK